MKVYWFSEVCQEGSKNINIHRDVSSSQTKMPYAILENEDFREDTEQLFKNIVREILRPEHRNENVECNSTILSKVNIKFNVENRAKNRIPQSPIVHGCKIRSKGVISRNKDPWNLPTRKANEMSFSFLINKNTFESLKDASTKCITDVTNADFVSSADVMSQTHVDTHVNNTLNVYNDLPVIDFKPTYVSTPKRERSTLRTAQLMNSSAKITNNKNERNKPLNNILKNKKSFKTKNKEIKHRSLSGKLFNAINDSCTVILNTVKNIFRSNKKNINDTSKESNVLTLSGSPVMRKEPCSFSFTNYMRRRDAIYENKFYNTRSTHLEQAENGGGLKTGTSCETCNDTEKLKFKLDNDNHLRQTIKKLKIGINLYGCDFKVR